MEGLFDGKTFTLLGKNANIYFQADTPGTFDQLVNELQEKFQRPLPGADLLLTNSYDELMSDVIEIGSRQWLNPRTKYVFAPDQTANVSQPPRSPASAA
jgi:uncharacterized protein DUF2092